MEKTAEDASLIKKLLPLYKGQKKIVQDSNQGEF